MRTTVDLPAELLRAAKARAAADGETLKEFLTRAVAHELGSSAVPRPRRSRVALPLVGSGRSMVDVTNEDIAELLAGDDSENYGR